MLVLIATLDVLAFLFSRDSNTSNNGCIFFVEANLFVEVTTFATDDEMAGVECGMI